MRKELLVSKQTFNIPDIGGAEAQVIEIMVKAGDTVALETPLFLLEGDKASMEVPSDSAGVVTDILIKVGDQVQEGMPMVVLETASDNTSTKTEAPKQSEPKQDVPSAPKEAIETDLILPDLGTDDAVEVIDIMVSAGDAVKAEQDIFTLEGDKASMDIPALMDGTIISLSISKGDQVKTGDIVGKIKGVTVAAQVPVSHPAQAPVPTQSAPAKQVSVPANQSDTIYAGPSVRRIASELSIDLTKVRGTGNKGRITKDDLKDFLSGGSTGGAGLPFEIAKAPRIDFAKYGPIQTVELNKIKRATAANMTRNWITIPHVTQFGDANITGLEAYRQKHKAAALEQGVRLTPIAFIMKALVKVLKAHPNMNASLSNDGKSLIIKDYYHIGVAVDTPNGLVVPVIKDADQKSVMELAKELGDISLKARDGKLKMTDMQGGTFTISSLGGIGGTAFTPIVNAPEVAILGVSKSAMAPVYNKETKAFDAQLMLPLCMSYDHRVIDGAQGARFVVDLAAALSDVESLLL